MCEYCGDDYSECRMHYYFKKATECGCNAATGRIQYNPVTHVIFGLDGTLIDSEPVYIKIINDIITKELEEPENEEQIIPQVSDGLRLKCMGRRRNDQLQMIINEMKLPMNVDNFYGQFRDALIVEATNIKLMPGVKKVVRHFFRKRVPMCIATSCGQVEFTTTTGHLSDILDLIDYRLYGGTDEEIRFGKPHPEIFQTAAFRFSGHPIPRQCLVIESSIAGIDAAVAAGMQVVMIPGKGVPWEQYLKTRVVLESLETFDPDMFHLPSRDWAAEAKEQRVEEMKKEEEMKEERRRMIAEKIAERERLLEEIEAGRKPRKPPPPPKKKRRDDDDD